MSNTLPTNKLRKKGEREKRSNLKPTTKTNILLNLNLYVGNKRGIKYGI